jgi:hypothetical protein
MQEYYFKLILVDTHSASPEVLTTYLEYIYCLTVQSGKSVSLAEVHIAYSAICLNLNRFRIA